MIWLALACVAPDAASARIAWLRDTLTRDNSIWLTRDPALLEGKYARMAADRFDFLRGTAALFYADMARPDPDRAPTTFLTDPAAATVLLAGDPHPENFGTMRPGEPQDAAGLVLEITDLDGGAFGAWLLDARRGALGVATLATGHPDCDAACRDDVVAAYAAAYAHALATEDTGELRCTDTDSAAVAATCASALADDGVTLAELTLDGHFVLDTTLDDRGKGLLALTADESAQLDRLLAAWDRAPAGFRVLDRARRFGVGVSSFPAVRYGVLWDQGEGTAPQLLNVREVVDPPAPAGRAPTVPALFDDNAARIEQVAWMLWSRADADARMAGLSDGDSTFKVTTWADTSSGFEHSTLQEGDVADLPDFAAVIGRSLGTAHARGVTAEGDPAAPVLAAELQGREDTLVAELGAAATEDVARLDADLAYFQAALDTYGPRLGAETPTDDTPR